MYDTKILIVDDEKENVRYLQTVLEENGFKEIFAAYDGEEGFEKVQEVRPGLILLDLRMPKKSGIWVFNELKKSTLYKDIPVIILTGEGGFLRHLAQLREFHEDKEALGVLNTEEVLNRFIYSRPDAFLEKPVDPDMLMQVVRRLLITLDEIKKELLEKIKNVKKKMLQRDVEYQGYQFSLGEFLLGYLAMNSALIVNKVELPRGFFVRAKDDRVMTLDQGGLIRFQKSLRDYIFEIERIAFEHERAILGLKQMEEAQAYDTQRNWPSNRIGGLT